MLSQFPMMLHSMNYPHERVWRAESSPSGRNQESEDSRSTLPSPKKTSGSVVVEKSGQDSLMEEVLMGAFG